MKQTLSLPFTRFEKCLWLFSVLLITVTYLLFDRGSVLSLIASLLGVTSLIFAAKGNPAGLVMMIVFSILYGVISYSCAYYGEVLTYVLMTLPMTVYSLVEWLKNPYQGKKSEVRVNSVTRREILVISVWTVFVTVIFYFILGYFGTANLLPSTFSVATSFFAVCLTARRSPYFALAYAFNDVVLILLWLLAARQNPACYSVASCFLAFLANDVYGFLSWRKMERRQSGSF